jgi:hypothetical protein
MNTLRNTTAIAALLMAAAALPACGDDDEEEEGLSPAQRHGVGAACSDDNDCFVGETRLRCLEFKGGYCGLEGCDDAADCPAGSACVTHDDGQNYCFLVCRDKVECNHTRPSEIEANCSSNITFTDEAKDHKACVPPS